MFFEKTYFLKISTFLKIISKLPRYSGRVLFYGDHASKLVLEFLQKLTLSWVILLKRRSSVRNLLYEAPGCPHSQ
jgi:hypothetical protein